MQAYSILSWYFSNNPGNWSSLNCAPFSWLNSGSKLRFTAALKSAWCNLQFENKLPCKSLFSNLDLLRSHSEKLHSLMLQERNGVLLKFKFRKPQKSNWDFTNFKESEKVFTSEKSTPIILTSKKEQRWKPVCRSLLLLKLHASNVQSINFASPNSNPSKLHCLKVQFSNSAPLRFWARKSRDSYSLSAW